MNYLNKFKELYGEVESRYFKVLKQYHEITKYNYITLDDSIRFLKFNPKKENECTAIIAWCVEFNLEGHRLFEGGATILWPEIIAWESEEDMENENTDCSAAIDLSFPENLNAFIKLLTEIEKKT